MRRFRLSIVFTERQALLDFVALLKREQLLPARMEPRRLDPGATVDPPTEEWVIEDRDRA